MNLSLPFTDPVLIFSLVLFIILLTPIILKKFKIPGIVGLIIAGVLIGPNGFNLLLKDDSFRLFGNVGLLYIMFLAGLELDPGEFKKKRNHSLIFGLLTFIIPFTFGYLASFYVLHFSTSSSILLAIMFSTQTLVAYPIASRLGIIKNEAVAITVGGTIITDTLVLLVLSTVSASTNGVLNLDFWIKISVSFMLLIFVVIWGFPIIAKWFFKTIEGEKSSQFIFVLALVFLAAFFSQMAGIEPIIGAFLAGLALNRLVPSSSALMNRLEFVGNSLFIPFFLISIGMTVNVRTLINGPQALEVTGLLLAVAISTKWLAAFLTQKILKYNVIQRNVIFGLSSSHAAAALAVVLIGFNLKLLNENILNGTILLILISCLIASFITDNAGRKLAIFESEEIPLVPEQPERILVPISNPESIERLMDFAILLKDKKYKEPIYSLAVVDDDEDAREKLLISKKMLEKTVIQASAAENIAEVITRIDINVSSGIIRTIKEKAITDVVIGWSEKITTKDFIFGSILENILDNCEKTLWATRIIQPINTSDKIIVIVPPNAELEIGFKHWFDKIIILSKQIGAKIIFYAGESTISSLRASNNDPKNNFLNSQFSILDSGFDWDEMQSITKHVTLDDLFIAVSARKGTISYNNYLENIGKILTKNLPYLNSIIIYPEQSVQSNPDVSISSAGITTAPLHENIGRISKLGKAMKKVIKKEEKQ